MMGEIRAGASKYLADAMQRDAFCEERGDGGICPRIETWIEVEAALRFELEQARALLWVWTDMDPLRYDNEYSACPWCAFDYTNMRHESDCAFVQARVFLGIEGGGSDADS